jgi:hypothetical protein
VALVLNSGVEHVCVCVGGGAETASGPVDPSDTETVLSDPSSSSLGTPGNCANPDCVRERVCS